MTAFVKSLEKVLGEKTVKSVQVIEDRDKANNWWCVHIKGSFKLTEWTPALNARSIFVNEIEPYNHGHLELIVYSPKTGPYGGETSQ